jgi:hypothetical protein
MPSGSRPVHRQAVRRDPLNTLAGTLAGPRGPSLGAPGSSPRLPRCCWLRGRRRTHSRPGVAWANTAAARQVG